MRSILLASVTLAAVAAFPATAQDMAETASPETAAQVRTDDIVITATRRAQGLSSVPIAVSAVTAEALQNSGATDIRQLNQLSPSLLVSSTSSEAGAGVARIRGIGTVGDNPGLESSVAVFIDGVYRSRSGVGLTELGEVERIEVLRGPQGTLFGRNASAGLISIVTARPKFEVAGNAELTYGNFNFWRLAGSITGPVIDNVLALRLDGVYTKRDGFVTDVISGRTVNNRDRYLFRGQALYTPNDNVELRIIGDFAKRNEECCASTYLPFGAFQFNPANGLAEPIANPVVPIIRGLGGVITDDTYARETSITPGQGYRSDVTDWGISGELTWNFDNVTLTSITAYRDWKVSSGQDADFNNLDILWRSNQTRQFQTFSQELRLQGSAFNDRLDWLVGGYFASEDLALRDDLRYGQDYQRYADCVIANSFSGTAASIGIPGLLDTASPGCMNQAVATAIVTNPGIPAALSGPIALWSGLAIPGLFGYDAVAAAVGQPGNTLNGRGITLDSFDQNSRNFALFTHNVIGLTDTLSLTLGARYTNERKTLDVNLQGDNSLCNAIALNPDLGSLAGLPCVINGIEDFSTSSRLSEQEWTGTAVLSWEPTQGTLVYGSYSRGYKAGGFNLDRSALNGFAPDAEALKFEPELVDSFELGFKLDRRAVRLAVAGFYAIFDQFQLNTFNGTNFIVENIQSCRDDLNGADGDFPPLVPDAALTGSCDPDRTRGGVTTKGVEIETTLFPAPNVSANIGYTYADTSYRNNLTGIDGQPLATPLFNLPGQQLSNAPLHVVTGGMTWTPPISDTLSGLLYMDFRYQSEMNTGSDLFPEKREAGFMVVNARIGLNGNDRRWSVEAWAQNLFNEEFQQVSFNTPLQGSGTVAQTRRGGPSSTTLFGGFTGEPRTFGVTVRTRF